MLNFNWLENVDFNCNQVNLFGIANHIRWKQVKKNVDFNDSLNQWILNEKELWGEKKWFDTIGHNLSSKLNNNKHPPSWNFLFPLIDRTHIHE